MRDKMLIHRSFVEWTETAKTPEEYRSRWIAISDYGFYDKDSTLLPRWIKEQIDLDNKNSGRRVPQYTAWRKAVYKRDHFTCVLCGQVGGRLNAHHIKQYAYYPSLRYDVDNGVTLCEKCHRDIHRKKK